MSRPIRISSLYARAVSDLSPAEAEARNAGLRREISAATRWAVIDLEAVPSWGDRAIIERENARQNGGRS